MERRHSDCWFGRIGKCGSVRNLSTKKQRKRKIDHTKKGDEFIFPFADGAAKFSGRGHEFREPTLRREKTARSEGLRGEFQGEPKESQPTESEDDAEARKDFSAVQGDFIYRHHSAPRFELYVPKEETFPIPLKYIAVTRSTHTDLDVVQEKRIDDYWKKSVRFMETFHKILHYW